MAVGQIFKFVFKIGKNFFGTNSKSIADNYIKQGLKKVPKNKIPKDANVKKAPSVPNPRSGGKFTKPQPPAARPKTTAPARPKAPAKAPSKPSTQTTAPARPNPKTTAPARPATPSTGSRSTGGRGRKKAPLMDKKLVRERPNLPPAPKTSRPAVLRDSARPGAPEVGDLSPVVKPNNKSGEMPKKKVKVTPNNKSGEMPKKKKEDPKRKSSPRPKLRPTTPSKTPKKTNPPTPKTDPLKNWSDPRRKALKSKKIGQDAGDGMVWVVGKNSNALVRVKPNDPRVAEQKRLKKSL